MNDTEIKEIKIRRKDKKVHYVVSLKISRALEKIRTDYSKELNLKELTTEQFITIIIQKLKLSIK